MVVYRDIPSSSKDWRTRLGELAVTKQHWITGYTAKISPRSSISVDSPKPLTVLIFSQASLNVFVSFSQASRFQMEATGWPNLGHLSELRTMESREEELDSEFLRERQARDTLLTISTPPEISSFKIGLLITEDSLEFLREGLYSIS